MNSARARISENQRHTNRTHRHEGEIFLADVPGRFPMADIDRAQHPGGSVQLGIRLHIRGVYANEGAVRADRHRGARLASDTTSAVLRNRPERYLRLLRHGVQIKFRYNYSSFALLTGRCFVAQSFL